MIKHTDRPQRLVRYTTAVLANANADVETIELAANSAIAIGADGDQSYTVRCTNIDPADDHEFGYDDYAVTSAGTTIYHRGITGAVKVQIRNGASNLAPDLRIYGMSQP